jgi:phytoene dehydrogenase-like protein
VLDAVVLGSGPNGLAAAVALARAGLSVRVLEAAATPGGGTRTAELTLPGFRHDVCSAIHPLGVGSPFLRTLPLEDYGLQWINPPAPLAHPLDDGTAVVLERSVDATAAALGDDAGAYAGLFGPLVADAERILDEILGPLRRPPRHPLALARFGLPGLLPAARLARWRFRSEAARALFAGCAAHSLLPLGAAASASFGLVLAMLGHAVGWPLPRGGSQAIADALVGYLRALGGELECDRTVDSLDDLPAARAILLDLTPREVLRIASHRLPAGYRRALGRYRYGPGACKVDLALDGPIPWRAEACTRAATVHLGGTLEEIEESERSSHAGEHADRPFVLLAQPSVFDPTRAPPGRHVAWAYCHVPNSSSEDVSARIEAQVERFAPGFGERILARSVRTATDLERENPNYVGGDINGGLASLRQLGARPAARLDPYATPVEGVYLCSSATPPGGGVHGMCGWNAARSVLRRFRR